MGLLLAQSVSYGPVLAANASSNYSQSGPSGGVVIGSFANEANARRASSLAFTALANRGVNADLQIMPSANNGQALFRVIALPQADASSRRLLSTLRDNGYASAWHMNDVPNVGIVPAAPEQPTAVALNEQSQHQQALRHLCRPTHLLILGKNLLGNYRNCSIRVLASKRFMALKPA